MAGADSVEKLEDVIVRSAEQVAGQIRTAKDAISTVIFGQDRVIENTLVTILSGGHALLIGVPGLAKTKLVETLGITLGLDAKRIQFTPDLMPSDILGAEVLDESTSGKRSFRFISGPVFAQLLMADEINRASPRTQSALLQSMQEKHVTVAGNLFRRADNRVLELFDTVCASHAYLLDRFMAPPIASPCHEPHAKPMQRPCIR